SDGLKKAIRRASKSGQGRNGISTSGGRFPISGQVSGSMFVTMARCVAMLHWYVSITWGEIILAWYVTVGPLPSRLLSTFRAFVASAIAGGRMRSKYRSPTGKTRMRVLCSVQAKCGHAKAEQEQKRS